MDNFKLFMNTNKSEHLKELVQKGRERLNREMNVMSLVKRLRHVEIILENSLLHAKSRKVSVAHTYQNVIDLEHDNNENLQMVATMPEMAWKDIVAAAENPKNGDAANLP